MKTGVSMSRIINTRRSRKNRTMIKCDCSVCVNKGRKSCHYGWEPINGKCSRFGRNDYILTKEEVTQARQQTAINRQKNEEKRAVRKTSLELLSKALEDVITLDKIKSCDKITYSYFGNGKFGIKCKDPQEMIILVKYKTGKVGRFKVVK